MVDLGNHYFETTAFEEFLIKVKVDRDIEVPAEHIELQIPAENYCFYAGDIFI